MTWVIGVGATAALVGLIEQGIYGALTVALMGALQITASRATKLAMRRYKVAEVQAIIEDFKAGATG